jgi:hypothetical protein
VRLRQLASALLQSRRRFSGLPLAPGARRDLLGTVDRRPLAIQEIVWYRT